MIKKCLTEYEECKLLAQYLNLRRLKFSHIANETRTPYIGTRMKNKAMGVHPGVPDYIIIIPKRIDREARLLFIEMKRVKNGKISDQQISWIEELNKVPNIIAVSCNGFEKAKLIIDSYVK